MKTVNTFDEWRETEGNGASVRKAWDAAQANMPIKTCEWKLRDGVAAWITECAVSLCYQRSSYCPNCGGKVTIKQTTEQRLETMTEERDKYKSDFQLCDIKLGNELHRRAEAQMHLVALARFADRMGIDFDSLDIDDAFEYIKDNRLIK